MNRDIRISVGLPRHPKMVKLRRKVGERAFRCLITLWCFAAENRPNGNLSGMDDMDIAIASGWDSDDESMWIDALISCGFLDQTEAGVCLHDWVENNPWAAGAEQRSKKARNAANARHAKPIDARSIATSISEQCSEHDLAMQGAQASNAPSPSPSPSPDSEDKSSGEKSPPRNLEAMVFERGKRILGSGGQVTKLRMAYGRNDSHVIAILNEAETKENPAEWLAAIINRRTGLPEELRPPDVNGLTGRNRSHPGAGG